MTAKATALAEKPAGPPPPRAADKGDEELLTAYQAGQAAAFRVLVERHQAAVYRFCLRSLGNKEAAADAAQEVFLRVVRNAARWEQKAKFTTWMYTIARNYLIDEARKARFRKTDSLNQPVNKDEEGGEEKIDRVAATESPSDVVADGKRMREVIDGALAALPAEQREVFCLREHAGLSFQEIGESVGANENTVKSRMRYALVALRKALEQNGFRPPDSS